MTTLREAAQQALEALEYFVEDYQSEDGLDSMKHYARCNMEAITALKAALEQPEQEPVAYLYHDAQTAHDANPLLHSALLVFATERRPEYRNETPLYTHPPRREWRGLTVPEMVDLWRTATGDEFGGVERFARAIEAALKERNV
jgi:hypothetical protein